MAWHRVCLAMLCAQIGALCSEPLRIGVAKIDITPDSPVTLSGYESRKELSRGIHDPLSARAIAFEQGGQRVLLVSTDVLGFYGSSTEMLRSNILQHCQLQPSQLFLAAIHTHSAPTVTFDPVRGHSNNLAYSRQLEGKLATVADHALRDLRPAGLGSASGASPVGANRRQTVQDDKGKTKIILGRNPAASTDREVQVLAAVEAGKHSPMAVLFAYATHSTSLGPQNYTISGDVHGLAEQCVERYLGDGLVAPGFAGASGDIDPWYRVLPGFKSDKGWIPEPVLLGTMLGQEVVRVQEGITGFSDAGPIRSRLETLQLPGKQSSSAPGPEAANLAFNVTVARVGQVAFVGLGGEIFNEIGETIKKRSPFSMTVVITHCNGAAGYIPTRSSYADGGYEVQSSPFGAGAAELLCQHVTALLREL